LRAALACNLRTPFSSEIQGGKDGQQTTDPLPSNALSLPVVYVPGGHAASDLTCRRIKQCSERSEQEGARCCCVDKTPRDLVFSSEIQPQRSTAIRRCACRRGEGCVPPRAPTQRTPVSVWKIRRTCPDTYLWRTNSCVSLSVYHTQEANRMTKFSACSADLGVCIPQFRRKMKTNVSNNRNHIIGPNQ